MVVPTPKRIMLTQFLGSECRSGESRADRVLNKDGRGFGKPDSKLSGRSEPTTDPLVSGARRNHEPAWRENYLLLPLFAAIGALTQKHHHARMDSIAQSSKGAQACVANLSEARWVFEWPVEPLCLSQEYWALFARFIANRDDEIELLSLKLRDRLGPLRRDINADVMHDGHGFRTDGNRVRAGGEDLIEVTGLMAKQRLGIGAVAGALAGSLDDLSVAGVDAEFLDDTAAALTPGKCAVIVHISEEWITPVDTRMEALGGAVVRSARTRVEDEQRARDVAALRAEIDQLKAEHARAQADRKAKLQAKIDQLTVKLQAKLDQAKQRPERIKSETEAKVQALQKKAAKAQGDIKATLDARAKRIREEYEQSVAKQKQLVAGQLRAAAAKVEK